MKYILLLIISFISIAGWALWGEYRYSQGYRYAYHEIDYRLNEIIKDGKGNVTIKGLSLAFYPRKDKGIIIEKQKLTIAGAGGDSLQTEYANKHKGRK